MAIFGGIPLPKVIADVGPGGGLFTNMNAISQAGLANRKKQLENQYYGPKTDADIHNMISAKNLYGEKAGELSYLNTISQNPDKNYNKAVPNVFGNNNQQQNPGVFQALKNLFTGQNNNALTQPTGGGQPNNPPPSPQFNENAGGQGSRVTNPTDAPVATPSPEPNTESSSNKSPFVLDKQGNPVVVPEAGTVSDLDPNAEIKRSITQPLTSKNNADDVKDLNATAFNGDTNQTTLNNISDILGSPEFEQIRQTPLLGHHELQYYSKEGTPAQQNMVGQYYALTGQLIKNSSRDFAGQFRQGEQQLLEGMKPSSSDTVDTARGKMEALSYMNKMLTERSKETSKLMTEYGINKGQASKMADNKIDSKGMRQQIHDKLNPTITIRHKKTGKTETVSVQEARNRGVPNV